MVIGTYRGANIIALPSSPAFRQIELGMNDSNAVSKSPFTGLTNVQSWVGGDWWDASITLPQLTVKDAAVWTAFLAECRGMANVFYLTDTLHAKPHGTPHGIPVVDGVQASMSQSLATRGWRASTSRLLLPGDLLQLGTHLHRVLNVVASDANGHASIDLWPTLREPTTDGEALTLNNPRGLFRLAENRRPILSTETRLSAVSLKCVEAR